MRVAATFMLVLLTMAFSAPLALAQTSPGAQGYDRELGVIGEIEQVQPPADDDTPPPANEPTAAPTPPATAAAPSQGDLPFTGLEIGIVAAMGAALLGTGLVMRRTSRQGDDTV